MPDPYRSEPIEQTVKRNVDRINKLEESVAKALKNSITK